MRNFIQNNLSIICSFACGVVILIVSLQLGINITQSTLISCFVIAITFLVLFYVVKFSIYRKIGSLTNNIRLLRNKQFKDVNYSFAATENKDPLDKLNEEVISWFEQEKEEMEKLKKLENFRREFIGDVSHELKTPIFNIQGYIHTLLDGAIDDKKVRMDFLNKAARNTDRLSTLVDDLLIITQLETKELKLDKSNFILNELVSEVTESLEFKANEKNITFELKKGSDKSFIINGDRNRIRQVLNNLMDNSIKYGKTEGCTSIGCYDMGDKISVEISDNGIGMNEDHLPRLFERFYTVDKSRSREVGGTGLGLSIVKHILEAHNQVVNVRSSEGVGSTFSFTLDKGGNE